MGIADDVSTRVASALTGVKNQVVTATTDLFSHGPQPLEHTLRHDPTRVCSAPTPCRGG